MELKDSNRENLKSATISMETNCSRTIKMDLPSNSSESIINNIESNFCDCKNLINEINQNEPKLSALEIKPNLETNNTVPEKDLEKINTISPDLNSPNNFNSTHISNRSKSCELGGSIAPVEIQRSSTFDISSTISPLVSCVNITPKNSNLISPSRTKKVWSRGSGTLIFIDSKGKPLTSVAEDSITDLNSPTAYKFASNFSENLPSNLPSLHHAASTPIQPSYKRSVTANNPFYSEVFY